MARLLIVDNGGSELWEVTDPDNPGAATLLGAFPNGLVQPRGMASHAGRLLVAALGTHDELWEVANPDDPGVATLLGAFPSGLSGPTGMTSHGERLLMVSFNSREVWEVIDPDNPGAATLLGNFPSGLSHPRGMASHAGRLLVVDSVPSELWEVTDLNDLGAASLLGTFPSGLSHATGMTSYVPSMPPPLVRWLAEFPTSDPVHRFWSGDDDLTLDGKTYEGRNFISLSGAEASVDAPRNRMTASFAVVTPALRQALMQDPGPLTVVIEWIYSNDQGQTWRKAPRKFVGRLSRPVIRDGVYTIEIETFGGDIDRSSPLKWSHEDQMARSPGDRGLEYMAEISELMGDRAWPP